MRLGLSVQQLQERRSYIGASDVSKVVGLNEYAGAKDVFLAKRGPSIDEPMSLYAEWGHRLEDDIADAYRKAVGLDAWELTTGPTAFLAGVPWAACNPDRIGPDRPLQIKTAWTAKSQKKWGATMYPMPCEPEAIPLEYFVQVQWEMMVLDAADCDVAVWFPKPDLVIYRVPRNRAFGEALLEHCGTFYTEYLAPDVAPPAGWEAVPRRALQRDFPEIVPA